jgi:hypothetical protein
MCTSFTIISPESHQAETFVTKIAAKIGLHTSAPSPSALMFDELNLAQKGLSQNAFELAWRGYQQLLTKKMITNTGYLSICDLSQPSGNKRFYLIDLNNCSLYINTWVAHGKKSGAVYATKFSNTPESQQSSLGFYITAQTYNGEHGLSLRINGVEPGFNDNAMSRGIVIHGAKYVDGARARAGIMMGRSYGCPAVPENESKKIINTIKNGTCLFIYRPDKKYIQSSKILND